MEIREEAKQLVFFKFVMLSYIWTFCEFFCSLSVGGSDHYTSVIYQFPVLVMYEATDFAFVLLVSVAVTITLCDNAC